MLKHEHRTSQSSDEADIDQDSEDEAADMTSPPSSPKAAEAVATYARYIEANCSGRALEMLWSLQHRVKSDRIELKTATKKSQLSVAQFAVATPPAYPRSRTAASQLDNS